MEDRENITKRILKVASTIKAASKEDFDIESFKKLEKEARDIFKKFEYKDPKGLVELHWDFYPSFEKKLLVRADVTGKWIPSPEQLKWYSDAYAKADKIYQEGKKKLEDLAKKYDVKFVLQ